MPASLPMSMKTLVIKEPGGPLHLEERAMPQLRKGEVLVQMTASPINPSDLASLHGQYAVDWQFPFVPGMEGSGRIVDHNAGRFAAQLMGKKVAAFAGREGLWAEYAAVPFERVVPVGEKTRLDQAAMSLVNPLTAIALVSLAEKRGQTAIINTAAAGALGRMIRKRAVARGLKVINTVRQDAHIEALKADGAVHVLNQNHPDFAEELKHLARHYRANLAFDAIGGDFTLALLKAMPKGGEVMIYGGLAMAPTSLTPEHFVFHDKKITGFWLVNWLDRRPLALRLRDLYDVRRNLSGFALSKVAKVLTLDQAENAAQIYQNNMSAGKVLIAPGGLNPEVSSQS
ncbi:MAG: zinc-binding dehydrogenase [Pseudomonadota bacterium]